MAPTLFKRQCAFSSFDDPDCNDNDWWYSDTGLAVRYGVVAAFFIVVIGFLLLSYLHARRRISKGLPPMAYHRWLVSRRNQPRYNYDNQAAYYQGNQGGHPMQPWQHPPPAYNTWDAPPTYNPPQGGSKMSPDQNLAPAQGESQYAAGVSSQQVPQQEEVHPTYPQQAYPAPSEAAPQRTGGWAQRIKNFRR